MNKIRTLAMAELRVGGSIMIVATLAGLLPTLGFWMSYSENVVLEDPVLGLYMTGFGLISGAALLVLRPLETGAMSAGFSESILRLPVGTTAATLTVLVTRFCVISCAALVTAATVHAMFPERDVSDYVPVAVALYAAIQLADWLRAPIRGWATAVVIGCVGIGVYASLSESFGVRALYEMAVQRGGGSVLATAGWSAAVALVAAPVSVWAIRETRCGRRRGVPEIWEWPDYLPQLRRASDRPFGSAVAAQVWLELRSGRVILPLVTVGLLITAIGEYVYAQSAEHLLPMYFVAPLAGFVAVMAVAAQALIWSRGGSSRRGGTSQFYAFLPATAIELAVARTITTVILLVPVLATFTIVRFSTTPDFLFEVVASAYAIDLISAREIIWALGNYTVLLAMLLSMTAALQTRWGIATISILFAMLVVLLTATAGLPAYSVPETSFVMFTVLLGLTIVAYRRCWLAGLLSSRHAFVIAFVWAIVSCFVFSNAGTEIVRLSDHWTQIAGAGLTSAGMACCFVMPFAALLLEFHRSRGTGMPEDPAQHRDACALIATPRQRVLARATAALCALFAIWLCWPTPFAYEVTWRAQGLPTTPQELDEWYEAVPDHENAALAYMDVSEFHRKRLQRFEQWDRAHLDRHPKERRFESRHILYMNSCWEFGRDEPIPSNVMWHTERKARILSGPVAARLRDIQPGAYAGSRYPIDLSGLPFTDLDHLAPLRNMARDLSLDGLFSALDGDTKRAADNVDSIFDLADSLREEPTLISSMVRIGMHGVGVQSTETILNRSVPYGSDLAQMQTRLDHLAADEENWVDRGYVGETAIMASRLTDYASDYYKIPLRSRLGLPWRNLISASRTELLAFTYAMEIGRVRGKALDWKKDGTDEEHEKLIRTIAPLSILTVIVMPGTTRVFETEYRSRTYIDTARTAIAVERFRLAHGPLPESLNDLVPTYLEEVPLDFYTGYRDALQYRQLSDDSFVVYSVGRDAEDDNGIEMEKWHNEGDITFTVAPMSFRTGDHVGPPLEWDRFNKPIQNR